MTFKFYYIGYLVIAISVAYLTGNFFGRKNCNEKINSAVLAMQTDLELQLEKANSENQKVVIKTIKQNEKIKTAISSYDVVQRVRLLSQIENFEAGK